MRELESLSDSELNSQTQHMARREKAATLELLEHLLEVERRGLALRLGFGSVFEYVHRGLGYSEGAAGERVAAMRLLGRVPEAKEKLITQKLTLTTAAKVQTFVRALEKTERRRVEAIETLQLVAEVAGKSKREVEKLFLEKAPGAAIPKERVREVSVGLSEIKLVVNAEFVALLDEAKTLLSASSQTEVIERALRAMVAQKRKSLEPKRAVTRPAESTGKALPGAHVLPLARGGTTELVNLRLLCQAHNLERASAYELLDSSHRHLL